MSNNQTIDQAERRASTVLLAAGVTSLLRVDKMDSNLKFSVQQNYALATEEIFLRALERTVWAYRRSYEAVEIMVTNIQNIALESIATHNGIIKISELILSQPAYREFIHALQINFFSQFAEFNDNWALMIKNIAHGFTNTMPSSVAVNLKKSLRSEEIEERYYSVEELYDLLIANNWLIMTIFISLWGKILNHDELRYIQRRQLVKDSTVG